MTDINNMKGGKKEMENKSKSNWNKPADKAVVEKTILSLKENGINAYFANNALEAKNKALELIPKGSEVMVMTSLTSDLIGLTSELNESGKYDSVKSKLKKMDRKTQNQEMQKLGAAPKYSVGSVHAVTRDGKVLIASATGSQLPAYSYGSEKVIWIVGTQKIVKDVDEGMKRLYDYTLPLESERAKKAYGVEGSYVAKLLLINKEFNNERIHLIFVNENIGF